jgi:hypothetical protein
MTDAIPPRLLALKQMVDDDCAEYIRAMGPEGGNQVILMLCVLLGGVLAACSRDDVVMMIARLEETKGILGVQTAAAFIDYREGKIG